MAYTDTVLAKNPIQYCTLTGAAYSTNYSQDLTGNGYHIPGYTSSTTRPPLVPGQNIGAISTVAGTNPLGVMVRAGEKRKYSIELWATLNGWTFGTDNSSAKTIIQNDDATCKIYAENSFIKFLITDSDGNEYIASTNFNDWGQAFHLVASYGPDGFYVSVNADISDPVSIPKSSTFESTLSDLLTLDSTNFTLSHFAVYPKKLTLDEINSNYKAGKNFLDKEDLVKTMGASSYSLSKKESIYSYQKTLNSNDFLTGNIRNLILDRGSIKCISYKPVTLTDSSGTSVSPDYTGSPAFLPLYKNKTITNISNYSSGVRTVTCSAHSFNVGSTVVISGVTPSNLNETVVVLTTPDTTSFTYTSAATTGSYSSGGTAARIAYASITEVPGLSSLSGYIGIKTKINSDSGVGQKLFTLFSKASNKSWSWYLDGTKNLHLKVTTYDSEDTSTSVIYDYQSAATSGQDNQIIWLTFDQSGIKISGWGTAGIPSGFNPNRLSGTADAYIDNLPEQLSIDSKTELIFNSDESYSGGIANRLYYVWIGSSIPAEWTSDFTVLDDSDTLSVWYDFTGGNAKNLNARSQGEWTYTFDPAFEDKYYGSFIDFDLANDGLSKMTLKYRNGSYVDIKNKSHFPSSLVPFSGSFDTYALTNITGTVPGSRTATTSENHNLAVGNTVTISGSTSLSETVLISNITSNTFTYTSSLTGTYDSTEVVTANGESGPFSIKAILNSDNITENTPELNYIKIYFYGNNELTGNSNLGNAIISGQSVIIKPEEENIFHSGKKLNCTFNASSGYIQLPVVSEGDYRSIEFTFTIQGTLSAGSVLLSSRNTLNTSTNQLLINASNVVTVSGLDWPSSAVYINGNLLSSGTQTALTDSVNHVLIIADRTTDKSLYLNSNYDNTLWVSGASKYSSYGYINTWDYALSNDQRDAILASMKGLIFYRPEGIETTNAIAIQETASAKINTKPWAADSVI